MAFKRLLLPVAIDLQWRSAPGFQTTRVRTDNGREKRNPNWDSSLMRGVLHYNARDEPAWQDLDEMVQICQGMAHSFMVRDPRKNVATAAEGKFVAGQAVLRITRGSYSIDKPITKLDSSVILTGGGTVDQWTGLILTGAPTAWAGPFYLCCIFGVDALELDGLDHEGADGEYIAGYKDVPIEEVLGE